MYRRIAPTLALVFAIQATACAGSPTSTTVNAMNTPPGIANIVRDRLRADLQRGSSVSAPFTFPAKVRIIPYDYESGMNPNDVLSVFDGLAKDLMAAKDVVSEASVLPKSYGESVGSSFEALLALRGSTKADIFLLVSGRSRIVEDREKFVWFWDKWSNKGYYEAHTSLDTLLIDAATGRFMPSLQAAAKAGPAFATNTTDGSASESSGYQLRTNVERQAFDKLATALIARLKSEKANPSVVASPSPAASGAPSGVASPGASAVPAPSGSAGFESGVGVNMGGLNGAAPTTPPAVNPVGVGVIAGVLVGLVVLGALAGGSRRSRLLQAEEQPLADATVYLADATGTAVPGLPTTKTDADGKYRLEGITKAGTYRLMAAGKSGEAPVTLSSLVTVKDGETEASVDSATTYVATAGAAGLISTTCTLNAEAFASASARVATAFASGTPSDLTDATAIGAAMAQLSLQAPELAADMVKLFSCP